MSNALGVINNDFENASEHPVPIQDEKVIGTGRIHFINQTAVISQMAIAPLYQKQKIGQKILLSLLDKCKELQIKKITLSARATAIDFYAKFGFQRIGMHYPSIKTGIIHQKMELILA